MSVLTLGMAIQQMDNPIDFIVNLIQWFHSRFPMVGIALVSIIVDIMFGLYAAVVTKTLSSKISQVGMVKKAAQLTWIAFACALEPYAGGLPMSGMMSTFFLIVNTISVMENSQRAGIPVPEFMSDWIQQRAHEKASVLTPPATHNQTTIQKASHVEISMMETSSNAKNSETKSSGMGEPAELVKK